MHDLTFFDCLFMIALVGLDMVVLDFIHIRNAKKCNYDCSKCKNWDCMTSYCDKKRRGVS